MCKSDNEGPMAIQIAPLVGAGLGALQQSKIQKAMEGTKTYSKPKTIFGKLIGGISGRSAAAEVSTNAQKTEPISSKVLSAMAPNQYKQTPITGGITFGQEAKARPWLPYAVVAAIVAIFYVLRRKGGRRRR